MKELSEELKKIALAADRSISGHFPGMFAACLAVGNAMVEQDRKDAAGPELTGVEKIDLPFVMSEARPSEHLVPAYNEKQVIRLVNSFLSRRRSLSEPYKSLILAGLTNQDTSLLHKAGIGYSGSTGAVPSESYDGLGPYIATVPSVLFQAVEAMGWKYFTVELRTDRQLIVRREVNSLSESQWAEVEKALTVELAKWVHWPQSVISAIRARLLPPKTPPEAIRDLLMIPPGEDGRKDSAKFCADANANMVEAYNRGLRGKREGGQ